MWRVCVLAELESLRLCVGLRGRKQQTTVFCLGFLFFGQLDLTGISCGFLWLAFRPSSCMFLLKMHQQASRQAHVYLPHADLRQAQHRALYVVYLGCQKSWNEIQYTPSSRYGHTCTNIQEQWDNWLALHVVLSVLSDSIHCFVHGWELQMQAR